MSSELIENFANLLRNYESDIAKKLLEKGVDKDIVDSVFTTDTDGGGEEVESTPVPTKRFLPPNTGSASTTVRTTDTSSTYNSAEYQPTEKYPQDYSDGKVILVLNYGKMSHALFGDFGKRYVKFKDTFLMKDSTLVGYNANLRYGPGWTIKSKARYGEVTKALENAKIKFRVVEDGEFLKECQERKNSAPKENDGSSTSSSGEEETKPKVEEPKPKAKVEAPKESKQSKTVETKTTPKANAVEEAPKKEIVSKKVEAAKIEVPKKEVKKAEPVVTTASAKDAGERKPIKNKFGNFVDPETEAVLVNLPVKKGGGKLRIAVGYQDPNSTAKGLKSVKRFDAVFEKECQKSGLTVLTQEMITLTSKSKESAHIAEELQEMWDNGEPDDTQSSNAESTDESESASGESDE